MVSVAKLSKGYFPKSSSIILVIGSFLAFTIIFSLINNGVVSAAITSGPFYDAYTKMDTSLPDDSYTLYKSGNPVGSSTDCNSDPQYPGQVNGKWGCTADNYFYFPDNADNSHQYITLSNCSINDDASCSTYPGTTVELAIYTTTPGIKNLSIALVDRGIGDSLACYNSLTAYYYKGTSYVAGGGIGTPVSKGTNGCSQNYQLRDFPGTGFEQIVQNGVATGLYKGRIVLRYDTGNINKSQMSFHINASGARLGYIGSVASDGSASDPLPTSNSSEHAWTNVYPTNYARTSKVRFYFRPQCSTTPSTGFNIQWDDVNSGNPTIQPSSLATPTATLYKFIPGDIGSRTVVQIFNSLGTNYQIRGGIATQNYGANQPYAYMMEFDGIAGGNGISFNYPFDSGDARIPCPATPPPSSFNASCSNISFTIPANGSTEESPSDATNNDRYRVWVNDGGSPGTAVGSPDFGNTAAEGSVVNIDLEANSKIVSGVLSYTIQIHKNTNLSSPVIKTISGSSPGNCYTASCTITIFGNVPGGGSNDVQAGQPFGVAVNVTNTGINDLPATLRSGYQLSGTLIKDGIWGPNPDGEEFSGLAPARIGVTINPTGTGSRYFVLNAPNDQNVHTVRMYPDYWGTMGIGGICPGSTGGSGEPVVTFQRYDFNASASTALDDPESPTAAYHNTGIIKVGAVDVDGTSTRIFYKRRNAANNQVAGPYDEFRAFQTVNYADTYTIPPASYTLGDVYCVSINLDRGHGWRSGNTYINQGPAYAQNCNPPCPPGNTCVQAPTVKNNPYVRTYGEDIAAGGGFGTACGRTNSGILAFMRPLDEQNTTNDRSGSGSQLAAMALAPISGFTSASLRNTTPALPKGLTFAHDSSAPDQTVVNPLLGGSMDGNGWCMPDYFASTQFTDPAKKNVSTSTAPLNIMSLTNQQQTVRNIGSSKLRIIGNPAPAYTSHHTIYVDGDVFISGDIKYNTSYVGGIPTIPSFTLVVKGNIYIDKDVSQLDGLYIAQPNPGRANTGRIYTCANATGDAIIDGAGLFSQCGADESASRKQLTVNGSFLAERVVLNRSGYSLRDSRFKEPGNSSKASEIFNFSPEMYLSPPVFQPNSTSTSGEYDYLSVLAPFL